MPGTKASTKTPSPLSQTEAHAAIADYTRIIESRLRPALDAATEARDKAQHALLETEQMERGLELIQLAAQQPTSPPDETGQPAPRLQTRVNIGHEFYIKANIQQLDPIIVDVGLGVLVEMSHQELHRFIAARTTFYKTQVHRASNRIEHIQAHLKSLLNYLTQLQGLAADAHLFDPLTVAMHED